MHERLYRLLPELYRRRDAENGQPLRALLAVMEVELDRLEADVAAAYDNWFIETCDAWVIPYLADLVGAEISVDEFQEGAPLPGQRRRVANQIAYQRRKGLADTLTHVVRDVTGWHAYAVEAGRLAARTPDVRLGPVHGGGAVDVRRALPPQSPFNAAPRTLNVRRIAAAENGRSQPGIPHPDAIALFLWRLSSFPVRTAQAGVSPRVRRGEKTRHFTFDPLGREGPLFTHPQTPADVDAPLRPEHMPQPLTRPRLAADLARPQPRLYGPEKSVAVWVNGRLLPAESIISGDLGLGTAVWEAALRTKQAVIDVARGQILLADYAPRDGVRVTYATGQSGPLGCSGTGRTPQPDIPPGALLIELLRDEENPDAWDAADPQRPLRVNSVGAALAAWEAFCQHQPDHPCAVILFLDSGIYDEAALAMALPSGAQLTFAAAAGVRPVVRAEALRLGPPPRFGLGAAAVVYDRRLTLQGLLLDAPLVGAGFAGGQLAVEIAHCTLPAGLDLSDAGAAVQVTVAGSLVGGVNVAANGRCTLKDSIVQGTVAGGEAALARVTVVGDVAAARLAALHDSIVTGAVRAGSAEAGAVRTSYLGQLDSELAADGCVVGERERPSFTSLDPMQPGFAQLRAATPRTIREGAGNGAEMGAFNRLHNARRLKNLAHILPDFLPLGQEAGVFCVT